MFKISLNEIDKLFAAFAKENAVYAPIKQDDNSSNYKMWSEGMEVCLTNLNTVKSPKDIFFPQTENIVDFKMEGKNVDVVDSFAMERGDRFSIEVAKDRVAV